MPQTPHRGFHHHGRAILPRHRPPGGAFPHEMGPILENAAAFCRKTTLKKPKGSLGDRLDAKIGQAWDGVNIDGGGSLSLLGYDPPYLGFI